MSLRDRLERAGLLRALEANRNRRAVAVVEMGAARDELASLVRRGAEDMGIEKTELAKAAGINRERVYDLLRSDRALAGVYKQEETDERD